MSSADEVATLPGGGEFAALWKQVDGDAGAIGELAAHLTKAGDELGQVRTAVTRSVHGVDAGWNGPAADAFGSYMARVSSASNDVDTALATASKALTAAAQDVTSARSQLNTIASHILDQVGDVDPESPQVHGLVEAIVAQGCAAAKPVVTSLSGRLESAASGLASALDTGGFVALHPPGEGSYLPAHGGRINWQAVPKDGESTTAPASSGGAGAGSGGSGGSGGGGTASFAGGGGSGPPAAQPTGDVKTWIEQATKILVAHGVPAGDIDPAAINTIIQHESSGNPHAENLTDSNAAAGHPSKGLMQTIDSTFDAHALPGHHDIWNPVDNIIAGVRYALSRYGSLDNVPGVKAEASGGSYVGY